ncbi:hypothetical protein EVAR_24243_1 [Eumeta japonica]|uniref:Uncharacterized protein n=1 Tax=Eumeta variegata TaxID=151549 RepID=A0A4C1W692_EUMVA|nr:hypothetical protein EVAR_24243_1 [Eumeta japonica]
MRSVRSFVGLPHPICGCRGPNLKISRDNRRSRGVVSGYTDIILDRPVSGSDGEVKCAPRTQGVAERGESTGKGRGATTRIALMSALRIPGAMRAHDGRDAGSQHAGGALPETISP